MPSFKIVSNLFIIFTNKYNDSINMIYRAILLLFLLLLLLFFYPFLFYPTTSIYYLR